MCDLSRRKENVLLTCVYKTITWTNGYNSVGQFKHETIIAIIIRRIVYENEVVMIASLVMLLVGVCDNSASPAGTAHMTVSKMRIADLETSAGGYAYNQPTGLPVSYVRYTNHGSGRYYHAPTSVHYVAGSSAPVALTVSKTASSHEPVLLAYATAKREIVPYALRQPYLRDGFINYNMGQLAKYAQPLEPPKLAAASAPYHTPGVIKSDEMDTDTVNKSDNKENEENEKDDYDNDSENNDGDKEDDADHMTKNHEKAVDFIATRPFYGPDNPRSHIDVPLELSEKYSAVQNFAHGEKGDKGDKGYNKQMEFDVGEREQHDKSKQQGRLSFIFRRLLNSLIDLDIYISA